MLPCHPEHGRREKLSYFVWLRRRTVRGYLWSPDRLSMAGTEGVILWRRIALGEKTIRMI